MTPTDLVDKLTASETDLLAQCEDVISRGLRTFIETGNALADVRDNRLYRATFATFEDYCFERWGISRPRAYELMLAAAVVSEISDKIDVPPPTNDAQARELAKVPEADRPEVWTKAHEQTDGKPTAAAVKEIREADQRAHDVMAGRSYPTPQPVAAKTWNRPTPVPSHASGQSATSDASPTVDAEPVSAMADTPDDRSGVQLDSNNGDAVDIGIAAMTTSSPALAPTAPIQLGRSRPEPLDDLDVIDEEQAKRGSNTVAASLAGLWMVLDPNPVAWIAARYRRDAYRFRDLPHVRDALTADGLRTMAKHLSAIADHLDKNGERL